MTLKVTQTINYQVGFRQYPNLNSTVALAGGISKVLNWTLADSAFHLVSSSVALSLTAFLGQLF